MGEYFREMEMIDTETLQISEESLPSKRSTLPSRSISGFVFVMSDEDPYSTMEKYMPNSVVE
jgi:hypothetical protein